MNQTLNKMAFGYEGVFTDNGLGSTKNPQLGAPVVQVLSTLKYILWETIFMFCWVSNVSGHQMEHE